MPGYPAVGESFGPFLITEVLGRGGMGVVFAARQERLGRTVALKVVDPKFAFDEAFRRRFGHEAGLMSAMDSPHIIRVYDHGEIDGCLYLATQLVKGGDLSRHLARGGAMPPAEALDLCIQIVLALNEAHGHGVVHRDVKPSNVLLSRNGDTLFAYLCDFGIAHDGENGLTSTGMVVGSWGFMAPERHEGTPATPQADIYSAGCVLWAMLTGANPYTGSDVKVAMAHMTAPVPQLPATAEPWLSINTLVASMMAKNPTQRPASTTELLGTLRKVRRQVDEDLPAWPDWKPVTPAAAQPAPVARTLEDAPAQRAVSPAPSDMGRGQASLPAPPVVPAPAARLVAVPQQPTPNPTPANDARTVRRPPAQVIMSPPYAATPSPAPGPMAQPAAAALDRDGATMLKTPEVGAPSPPVAAASAAEPSPVTSPPRSKPAPLIPIPPRPSVPRAKWMLTSALWVASPILVVLASLGIWWVANSYTCWDGSSATSMEQCGSDPSGEAGLRYVFPALAAAGPDCETTTDSYGGVSARCPRGDGGTSVLNYYPVTAKPGNGSAAVYLDGGLMGYRSSSCFWTHDHFRMCVKDGGTWSDADLAVHPDDLQGHRTWFGPRTFTWAP